MFSDFRLAIRLVTRRPGFALIVVATLAVGIGAASAIFGIYDAVVLRPLPYGDPDRMVRLYETKRDEPRSNFSGPDFLDYQSQGRSVFSAVAAYREAAVNMTGGGTPAWLDAVITTADYFAVFETPAHRGRVYRTVDATLAARPVVLSHAAWQKHFGGADAIVGTVVRLHQQPHLVVGVMPPHFPAGAGPDIWVMAQKDLPETPFPDPRDLEHNRSVHYLSVIARLRPGVSQAAAQAAVATIASRLARQYPESNGDRSARVLSMHEDLVGDVRPALALLLAAVGLTLAVVAVNVANLLLARGATRQKEIAVRAALGGSRSRLVRQALAESLVLGVVGGVGGLLLATWGIDLLVAFAPDNIPRLADARVDLRVAGVASALSFAVAVLAGVVAAIANTRADIVSRLRQGGADSRAHANRVRSVLVVGEVAAAVVLLVSAVLVGRSFLTLKGVGLGFDPQRLFTVALPLPESEYREEAQQREFFRLLMPRLAALRGVQSVAAVFPAPLSGGGAGASFEIEGRGAETGGARNYASLAFITPDYFTVLGVPVVDGRAFTERDTDGAPKVIVVNRRMAEKYWPGQRAIGKRIRFQAGEEQPWLEVVGVVADVRTHDLKALPAPEFYVAHAQSALPFMSIVFRSPGDTGDLAGGMRAQVASLDPNLPIGAIRPLTERIDEQTSSPRFRSLLLMLFGGSALLLAALGVYGVIGYSVARRTSELGIRLALGATPRQVRSLVMRQGIALAGAGAVAGLAGSWLAARWLRGLLYGVSPTDPATAAVVVLVLVLVAAFASYLPSRRAMRIDPIDALRAE